MGDGETEAELQRWHHVPRTSRRRLCPSRHLARCVAEHPPTGLQPPQAETAPALLGKRGHSTEELYRGISLPSWPQPGRAAVMCQGQVGRGADGDRPGGCWHLGAAGMGQGPIRERLPPGWWAHGARRGVKPPGTSLGGFGASSGGSRGCAHPGCGRTPPRDGTGRGARGAGGPPDPARGVPQWAGDAAGVGMGPGPSAAGPGTGDR